MGDIYEKYSPGCEWWDCSFDDFKAVGAIIGFDITNIYFSGFSSQGDGACFEGSLSYRKGARKEIRAYAPEDTELHAIADRWFELHASTFFQLSGNVKQSGHYSHEHCTSFDWYSERSGSWLNSHEESVADDMKDCARDFMRWIYRQLESEYDYQYAWGFARGWQDLGDEMKETRSNARQLVADMRAAIKSGIDAAPSICGALRNQLRALLSEWEEKREERDEIESAFSYKRMNVAEFARLNL